MIVNSSLTASACERGNHLQGANESPTYKVRGAAFAPYLISRARTIASRMKKRSRRFMAASVTLAFVKSIPDHRSACFLKNATLRPLAGDRSVRSKRESFRSVSADVHGA